VSRSLKKETCCGSTENNGSSTVKLSLRSGVKRDSNI